MDDLTFSLSWQAAPRSGTILVQHPAWEEARNAVLDLAAEGPVTVFLTGEPGSGKTWLLRELAASLGSHGFPTMVLLRGDLPIPLGDGVAVLIDEARYMPDETRAELATQDRGVVVLADIEPFADHSIDGGPKPVLIHLRLLDAHELGPFAADWLQQNGLSSATLDPGGLARLVDHSAGAVRVVVQLLTAATAMVRSTGHLHLTAAVIDEVAAFRLGTSISDLAPAPAQPATPAIASPAIPVLPPLPEKPTNRFDYRWALVGTALAASVLAIVVVPGMLHRAPSVEATALQAPKLPPIESAQLAAPAVVSPVPPVVIASRVTPESTMPTPTSATPTLADRIAPAPSSDPTPIAASPHRPAPEAMPPLQPADVSTATATAPAVPPLLAPRAAVPTLAQAASPQTVSPAPVAPLPEAIASLPQPTVIPVITTAAIAPVPAVARKAAAGLVLVAQHGDTLERLYADIYRDRHAPPFTEILAANPRPFKPGVIVVFPEPIGGWSKVQR